MRRLALVVVGIVSLLGCGGDDSGISDAYAACQRFVTEQAPDADFPSIDAEDVSIDDRGDEGMVVNGWYDTVTGEGRRRTLYECSTTDRGGEWQNLGVRFLLSGVVVGSEGQTTMTL